MVEVYFNAQSNNGTLTDGEFVYGGVDSGLHDVAVPF